MHNRSRRGFAVAASRRHGIIAVSYTHLDVYKRQLILLAHSISQKIEEKLDYPGQIKVNVIRESRAVDYAQ